MPATTLKSSRSRANRDIMQVGDQLVGAVETPLGWIAVAGANGAVTHLSIGHRTRENAIAALPIERPTSSQTRIAETQWLVELLQRIRDYGEGVPDDFRDVKVDRPDLTPFGRKVIAELRKIGYGESASYADLAERAGSPRAARAVGRVMATNRIPLILPCHRVVGAGGRLGGFSAPQGTELKRQLLALEGHGEFEA
jgi:methylated-DNA-[protein]-cysteine S-methyltransferase